MNNMCVLFIIIQEIKIIPMATIKVIFRESSNASDEGSLFYRVIHQRKMRQIHSGYRVKRNEWNDAVREINVCDVDPSRLEYLRNVQSQLKDGEARFCRIIAGLAKSEHNFSVDDVIERFHSPEIAIGFLSFARKHINKQKQIGKSRSAEHYATALNSFIRFNGSNEVSFDDFNGNLMQKYEYYLKEEGLCPNSISFYMRNLRAIYNQAVEQGLTEQRNPFKHVYTGIAKTEKRAVTLTIIKCLRNLDLRQDWLSELARDLFLFSFCTRGMAIIDIAYLRKSNLKNGILVYRRQKTGQQLSVRWETQMQEIISKYSNKDSEFLFPMIDSECSDYRRQFHNAYSKLIRRLKKIGQQLGLSEPLTFHRSRHAWASIARDNNVPLSVICEGMGHDSEKTTRIYLSSLDTSVVDKANSEIMGLLDQ